MKTFIQRRYLLWDTVQPRFLAVSVAHQSLVFLTFAGSLFVPLIVKLHNTPLSSPEAGTIGYQFTTLHDSIWPAFPIALLLILIHSVFFSHRIAGPLYRFRNVFKAISQGDRAAFRLRMAALGPGEGSELEFREELDSRRRVNPYPIAKGRPD